MILSSSGSLPASVTKPLINRGVFMIHLLAGCLFPGNLHEPLSPDSAGTDFCPDPPILQYVPPAPFPNSLPRFTTSRCVARYWGGLLSIVCLPLMVSFEPSFGPTPTATILERADMRGNVSLLPTRGLLCPDYLHIRAHRYRSGNCAMRWA